MRPKNKITPTPILLVFLENKSDCTTSRSQKRLAAVPSKACVCV